MGQTLLFPDPKPLDQRLGRRFFRKAPQRPGVYLMKDANDNVLYVGKARDLKQRLNNYRLANPDRMPRRHLRMVREVARIEFQFCANESAALRRESKLLRSLKPKFNRAGVWPRKPRFVVWRVADKTLELGLAEIPQPGWHRFGPMGSSAVHLHRTLVQLLWLALNPTLSISELPNGWVQGRFLGVAAIYCGDAAEELISGLGSFFWGEASQLLSWLTLKFAPRTVAFERQFVRTGLETLEDFGSNQVRKGETRLQLALL